MKPEVLIQFSESDDHRVLVERHVFADMLNCAQNRMYDHQKEVRKRLGAVDLDAPTAGVEIQTILDDYRDVSRRLAVFETIEKEFKK